MKVTIIGGGGRVGSCAAYALQCGGLVAEIQILDANRELAEGEALDLLHGSALAGDQRIYAGDYARAADSDLFLITAGPAAQARGIAAGSDQSQRRLVRLDHGRDKNCGPAQGRPRICRVQSGGYPDPTGVAPDGTAVESGVSASARCWTRRGSAR